MYISRIDGLPDLVTLTYSNYIQYFWEEKPLNPIYSLSRLRRQPHNEDDLKIENDLKKEDDLKNEDNLKKEDNQKIMTTQKMKTI